jgi:hypothetical protein
MKNVGIGKIRVDSPAIRHTVAVNSRQAIIAIAVMKKPVMFMKNSPYRLGYRSRA